MKFQDWMIENYVSLNFVIHISNFIFHTSAQLSVVYGLPSSTEMRASKHPSNFFKHFDSIAGHEYRKLGCDDLSGLTYSQVRLFCLAVCKQDLYTYGS